LKIATSDHPDRHRDATALLEHVATESREVLDAERKVQLVLKLEPLLLLLSQDRVSNLKRILGRHHLLNRGVGDVAVNAQLRTLARNYVQVGSISRDHLFQQ
jgi:hypothetical protein